MKLNTFLNQNHYWQVTGTIKNHGDRIAWSNGTTWTRYAQQMNLR